MPIDPPQLKATRLNKGLSLRDAAELIGEPVSADILLRAENGSVPRPKAAKKIADFYGCEVTEIWPLEEEAV